MNYFMKKLNFNEKIMHSSKGSEMSDTSFFSCCLKTWDDFEQFVGE